MDQRYETGSFPLTLRAPGGWRGRAISVALLTSGWLLLGSCGDDPYYVEWDQGTDTVDLYSLQNTRPGLFNAFDFVNGYPVLLEVLGATGNWDVAVGGDAQGLTLLPTGALGIETTSGVKRVSGALADVTRAPQDSTEYVRIASVPLELGATYIIRTRVHANTSGETTCIFYAKMQPLTIDVETLRVRFVYGSNPNCGDTDLEP
ncbi:MAG: hypothetical protein AMXMBFR53_21040 [Gemmatimonadota bacterium]